MKKRLKISIVFFVSCLAVAVLTGRAILAQGGASDKPLVCPLDEEVPVGQLADQMNYTNNKMLSAMQNSIQASLSALSAGKKIVELVDSCKTENCASTSCRQTFEKKDGSPDLSDTSICKAGYTCSHYSPEVFVQATQNNDPAIPFIGCETIPGEVGTIKDHWYEIVSWVENVAGNACDTDYTAGCPGAYCYPCDDPVTTDRWCPNGESRRAFLGSEICPGGCSGLLCSGGSATLNAGDEYTVFKWTDNFTDWLTCYNSCYTGTGDSGECNVDWSEPVCVADPCSGNACNFTDIDYYMGIVSASAQTVKDAHQVIDDVFNKGVIDLPLLGNFCDIPLLGGFCTVSCWLNGLPVVGGLYACPTEVKADLQIFRKSSENIRKCQTEPADYLDVLLKEKSGKVLMRCQELMPSTMEACYLDNFFCCQ